MRLDDGYVFVGDFGDDVVQFFVAVFCFQLFFRSVFVGDFKDLEVAVGFFAKSSRSFPFEVYGFVQRYFAEPRFKIVAPKVGEGTVCRQERFLSHVFGVVYVSHDVEANRVDKVLVVNDDLLEQFGVSVYDLPNQIVFMFRDILLLTSVVWGIFGCERELVEALPPHPRKRRILLTPTRLRRFMGGLRYCDCHVLPISFVLRNKGNTAFGECYVLRVIVFILFRNKPVIYTDDAKK